MVPRKTGPTYFKRACSRNVQAVHRVILSEERERGSAVFPLKEGHELPKVKVRNTNFSATKAKHVLTHEALTTVQGRHRRHCLSYVMWTLCEPCLIPAVDSKHKLRRGAPGYHFHLVAELFEPFALGVGQHLQVGVSDVGTEAHLAVEREEVLLAGRRLLPGRGF